MVKRSQDGQPKTLFTERLKELMLKKISATDILAKVKDALYYTAITSLNLKDGKGRRFLSSLDALYKVDAFFEFDLPHGMVRITLDGSHYDKISRGETVYADQLIVWQPCLEDPASNPKEFNTYVDGIAQEIVEKLTKKAEQELKDLTN